MSKISWYDIQTLNHKEIKKKYKTTDLGVEQKIRTHLDGANAAERRQFYEGVWSKKKD